VSDTRELKFRAWDSILKEYGPNGAFIGFYIFGEVTCFELVYQRIGETMEKREHLQGVVLSGLNDFIIEQYTGFEDQYGHPIYEGDIVECSDAPGYGEDFYGVVEWNATAGAWYVVNDAHNIYDSIYDFTGYMCVGGDIHQYAWLLDEEGE